MKELKIVADNDETSLTIEGLCGQERYTYADGTVIQKSRKERAVKPPKTRNNGQWTEARYKGFVRSALRTAWMRWGPNQQTKKDARIARGVYMCAGYKRTPHEVGNSTKVEGTRRNNIFTDHIDPVGTHIDWDTTIERMFCEADNLQCLCRLCHDLKTKEEREALREAKKKC